MYGLPKRKQLFCIFLGFAAALCDVSHLETATEPPPPRPYAFGYAAGRFPGHIDRTHSEVSDGSGVVQGSYSYVDPRFQIRTVSYIADKNGFHPILNRQPAALPSDTPAVAAARNRHLQQYARIAHSHAAPQSVVVPLESVAVSRARDKHFQLFQKIAEEHARLAALQEQQNVIDESTARPVFLKD